MFQKGREKTGGRKPGGTNKKTQKWEEFASWFEEIGVDKLRREMDKLEGKEFVREFKELMEYFKPKLSRTEVKGEVDSKVNINITKTYKKD